MKRVLVTGAAGFIGRHTLGELVARGYDVHALTSTGRRVSTVPATWHDADLADSTRIRQLLTELRPTHLLHLAWYTAHGRYWESPENVSWLEHSLSLLREFITQGGHRVVLTGSCAEYDWRYGFCSEDVTPLTPSTLYGTAKLALYQMATRFAQVMSVSAAWGRLFFLFGPSEQPGRLVHSLVEALRRRTPLRCTHGHQVRDFLFVRDAASALAALLDSAVVGAVNVASGRPVTVRTLVDTAFDLGVWQDPGRANFGAVPAHADDPPVLIADVRRLSERVGWSPKYTLEQGLRETIESGPG